MGQADMRAPANPRNGLARRVLWIQVLTILALLMVWELLSRSGLFYEGVLPSTALIMRAIGSELADVGFYRDLGITMAETAVGFIYGSVIAISVGVWLGLSRYVRKMMEPYIVALGGTPKIIFLPILFLIFGLGFEAKVAKGAMSAFFPVVLSATSGFLQIPPVLLRVADSFNLTLRQKVWKIYLPAMSNPLMTGIRLGMAMAIIGVLAAEITSGSAGLGFRLIRSADQFRVPSVYAVTILIFAISSMINIAISTLQARMNRHERRQTGAFLALAAKTKIAETQ
jgi:ABC-type nitrate/sulfonate/bicarbonate transport system permease component